MYKRRERRSLTPCSHAGTRLQYMVNGLEQSIGSGQLAAGRLAIERSKIFSKLALDERILSSTRKNQQKVAQLPSKHLLIHLQYSCTHSRGLGSRGNSRSKFAMCWKVKVEEEQDLPMKYQGNNQFYHGAPVWVPPPDRGLATADLRNKLCVKYDLPEEDVQAALEFAESETMADVYCLTQVLTGAASSDAITEALNFNFRKDKLYLKYNDPKTGLAGCNLSADQERNKARILAAHDNEMEAKVVNVENLEEEETVRLQESIQGLPRDEALAKLGVPGPDFGRKAVLKTLFPGKPGFANRSPEDKAKLSAAYKVALKVLETSS